MLHRRASSWYAEQGLIEEALEHALEAGDASGATQLVEAHFLSAFAHQNLVALERWLGLLPEDQIQGSPGLLFARAWIAQIHGRLTDFYGLLTSAEQTLSNKWEQCKESGRPVFQDPLCARCARLELFSVLYGADAGEPGERPLRSGLAPAR